jgi:ATP-dependent RNA helicase DeaD
LLPLLCRRGHITRTEIGAIRITAAETMFEVAGPAAARFAASVKRTASPDTDEGSVAIEQVQGAPREAARANRREGRSEEAQGNAGGNNRGNEGRAAPKHQAKPFALAADRTTLKPRGGPGGPRSGGGNAGGGRPGGNFGGAPGGARSGSFKRPGGPGAGGKPGGKRPR